MLCLAVESTNNYFAIDTKIKLYLKIYEKIKAPQMKIILRATFPKW